MFAEEGTDGETEPSVEALDKDGQSARPMGLAKAEVGLCSRSLVSRFSIAQGADLQTVRLRVLAKEQATSPMVVNCAATDRFPLCVR